MSQTKLAAIFRHVRGSAKGTAQRPLIIDHPKRTCEWLHPAHDLPSVGRKNKYARTGSLTADNIHAARLDSLYWTCVHFHDQMFKY
jgi:hypothetical protein